MTRHIKNMNKKKTGIKTKNQFHSINPSSLNVRKKKKKRLRYKTMNIRYVVNISNTSVPCR